MIITLIMLVDTYMTRRIWIQRFPGVFFSFMFVKAVVSVQLPCRSWSTAQLQITTSSFTF